MQGTNGEVNTRPVVVASAAAREMNGMLIAGPTPFIASALVAVAGGSPRLVALYLIACQIVTILGVAARRESPRLRIWRSHRRRGGPDPWMRRGALRVYSTFCRSAC